MRSLRAGAYERDILSSGAFVSLQPALQPTQPSMSSGLGVLQFLGAVGMQRRIPELRIEPAPVVFTEMFENLQRDPAFLASGANSSEMKVRSRKNPQILHRGNVSK